MQTQCNRDPKSPSFWNSLTDVAGKFLLPWNRDPGTLQHCQMETEGNSAMTSIADGPLLALAAKGDSTSQG